MSSMGKPGGRSGLGVPVAAAQIPLLSGARWSAAPCHRSLKSREDVLDRDLKDPAFRAEWERTQFAHKVALRVIHYRVEHGLSQTELARRLGMRQPNIARLEAGQHEPSLTMLRRLSEVLDIEFHIDITPQQVAMTA